MKTNKLYWLGIVCLVFNLSACSTFTGVGKDNTPVPTALLTNYQSQVSPKLVWFTNADNGVGKDYSNLTLTFDNNQLFTADPKGQLAAVDASSGRLVWKVNLNASLMVGPAAADGVVITGDNNAGIFALSEDNGKILWHYTLPNLLVATPTIINNMVIVKTIDGQLWALRLTDGNVLWHYDHGSPAMVLAGGSKPLVVGNKIVTGYADGKLAAYDAKQGKLIWETQIAQPNGASDVEQMIDIVADPLLKGDTVYVVSYQGNLAAVDIANGDIKWQQPLSAYTGIAISRSTIFVTDDKSDIWAFNRNNGQLVWHQTYLRYRQITAPVVMNNALVVADGQGYIHWLDRRTGQTIGRVLVENKADIMVKPVVVGNNIYVETTKGKLYRFIT